MGGFKLRQVFVELADGGALQTAFAHAAASQRCAIFVIALDELFEKKSPLCTIHEHLIGNRAPGMSQDFSGTR